MPRRRLRDDPLLASVDRPPASSRDGRPLILKVTHSVTRARVSACVSPENPAISWVVARQFLVWSPISVGALSFRLDCPGRSPDRGPSPGSWPGLKPDSDSGTKPKPESRACARGNANAVAVNSQVVVGVLVGVVVI